MKHFKKKGFWLLYVAIVLAGVFIIVALGLQNQSPVIPDVSAQSTPGGISSYGLYDYASSNRLSYAGSFSTGYNIPGNLGAYGSSFGFIDYPRQTSGYCGLFTDGICGMGYGMGYYHYEPPPTSATCYAFCNGNTTDTCFSFLCTVGSGIPSRWILNIPTPGGQTYRSALCGGGGMNSLMTCSSSLFGGCGGGENYNKKYPTSVGCTSYGPYMGCLSYPIGGSASFFTQSPAM